MLPQPDYRRVFLEQRLCPRCLGTAHDGDHLAECPLLDEVSVSLDAQRDAHGAVRPIDLAHDLRLDLLTLLGKGSQDHVADLQPLYFQLDRHEAMLRLCGSASGSSSNKKAPFRGLHEERMMGLEPTTFCMASVSGCQ